MPVLHGTSGTRRTDREVEVERDGNVVHLRFRNPGGSWKSPVDVAVADLVAALDALPAESLVPGRTARGNYRLRVDARDHGHGDRPVVWPPRVYLWREGAGGWDVTIDAQQVRRAIAGA